MQIEELQAFLRDRIPLSAAMGVVVRVATPDFVELAAPLVPNVNHRDTAFGGSVSAVAILAAWSVLYVRMRAEGLAGRIVIRRNTMSYDRPITDDFVAFATAPAAKDWARLRATLARRRTARIEVKAWLECRGESVGEFDGEFAVLPPEEPDATPSPTP
jgi:thioesterase domain-containing protein